MRFRPITEQQALEIRTILVEECGFDFGARDGDAFLRVIRAAPTANPRKVCYEFRFMGSLGFDGKFRNNGDNDNIPHVDCYREDETPERLNIINAANKRLRALFTEDKSDAES